MFKGGLLQRNCYLAAEVLLVEVLVGRVDTDMAGARIFLSF